MYKYCQTCKHWGNEEVKDWRQHTLDAKPCALITMAETVERRGLEKSGLFNLSTGYPVAYEQEDNKKILEIEDQALKDNKAYCEDGSSYYAALITFPDFGCVMHEEGNTDVDGGTKV